MISFLVRIQFAPEDRTEVAEMLRELTAASRKEPGCVSYVSHTVEGNPDSVVIYEQWKDAQALEEHGQMPHFQKYAVGGLYQKMLERSREDLVAVV